MKITLISKIIFAILLFFLAVILNPEKEIHVGYIYRHSEKLTATGSFENNNELMDGLLSEALIYYELAYRNYYFVSIGNYRNTSSTSTTTIGFFGYIFIHVENE